MSEEFDSDFALSRATYLALIKSGQEALDLMIEVARESEHPRSYEVLGGMLKQVSDVTDRLMATHKTKAEILAKQGVPAGDVPQIGSVTQHVYVGSTVDLQRMLIAQQEEEKSNVIDITDYRNE